MYYRFPHHEKPVDILIIGAGPAGLAAATYLAHQNASFLLLESGLPIERRQRDQPHSVIRGVGGAGLYSDGKFSFFPSASSLWTLSNQTTLHEAYSWLSEMLTKEGLDVPALPETSYPPDNHRHVTQRSKSYPSLLLTISSRENLIRRLFDEIRADARTPAHVISIQSTSDGFQVIADSNRGHRIYNTRQIIFAGGRYGPLELSRLMPDATMRFRRYEIGIRVEQPSDAFIFRDHPSRDVKELTQGPTEESEWRTFCTCRNGEVIETIWNNSRTYSARADGPPTLKSSFGLNLRFTTPQDDDPIETEIGDVLMGQLAPFSTSISDFLDSSKIYFGPILDQMFRDYLMKRLSAPKESMATIHGPCIEGVGYYPDINNDLKLNSKEMWVAGDCSGIFRGLTAALVSGYYCGKRAYDSLVAETTPPSFVKTSPSASMPVVFTAQSKTHFYCRDVVCEFTLKQGHLPLHPFRIFDYFLGDRVERDLVRRGNNQLVSTAEELWVFGPISDGVLFEIVRARTLRKPIRFFTIATSLDGIHPISVNDVKFEPEVHAFQIKREDLLSLLADEMPSFYGGQEIDQLAFDF